MKTMKISYWLLLSAVTMAWLAGPVDLLQPAAAQGSDNNPSPAAEASSWLNEVTAAGPEHQRLEPLLGDWDTAITLWANSTEEQPLKLQGSAKRQWVLDGRFIEERAENPNPAGAYSSVSYMGYNRVTGLFEISWMNNQLTGMFFESGRYNPADNVIRTLGNYADAASGFVIQTRSDISITGPDSHTMTGYLTGPDGREFKNIEIVYTRKK